MRVLVDDAVALVCCAGLRRRRSVGRRVFPEDGDAGPQPAPAAPLSQDQRSEFERWWDQQARVDVPFSNDGAKVLVVKFNDYQCPPCRQTYFAYKPMLAKYKDRPQDVKY